LILLKHGGPSRKKASLYGKVAQIYFALRGSFLLCAQHQCGAEGKSASIPGTRACVAGAVLCQAAIERVSGDEVFEEEAGRKDDAAVPEVDSAVRAEPGASLGRNAPILAGAHREDVALHQIQRNH